MSSRRIRRLRNRQDRTNIHNQLRKEVQEPFMEQSQDNQEQNLNIDTQKEPLENESLTNTLSEDQLKAVTQGVNEDNVVETAVEANLENLTATENESVEPQVSTEPQTVAQNQETLEQVNQPLESAPDFSSEEKLQSTDVEDPDLVPQSTTLSDDNVPRRAGAILLHCREKLGLSIREVANRLNTRINTISDIEHDRLNQPTAVPFTSVHIANYAKLVNLDPNLLVDMYKEAVAATVQENENAHKNKDSEHHVSKGLKVFSLIALVLFGFGLGLIIYKLFSTPSESSTGSLVIEDTVNPSQDEEGTLTLDTKNSKLKAKVVEEAPLVDENTLMAKEQAENLDTNEIIDAQAKTVDDEVEDIDSHMSLKVKTQNTVDEKTKQKIAAIEKEQQNNSLQPVSLNTKTETKALEIKKDQKEATVKTETLKANTQKTEDKKVETAKQEQSTTPVATESQVALSAQLKDISSRVRLAGKRDPFESFNTVSIRVLHDAALKVTANGKVLKQGNFKAGQTIKVTGIPPLRVSVNDTSSIRVTYLGTTLAVPSAKQVTFELPKL